MLFKHLLPVALAVTVAAQSDQQNLTTVLASNPDLSTLTQLLSGQTDLLRSLATARDITVVAPNNDAFSRYMNNSGAQAAAQPSMLTGTLSYHVLKGTIQADQITEKPTFATTMLTSPAFTNVTGGQKIEAVKMGNNVYFISGERMNSTVVKAVSDRSSTPPALTDVKFNGGVVHIVDTVLTVPKKDSTTAVDAGLTSLAGALTQAGLVDAVDNMMDVTIFAPTNAAFAAVGGSLENIPKDQLTSILTYHVVNGTVAFSSGLTDGMMVPTLNGGKVKITLQDGNVFVNSAKVVIPDVLVSNGVVHVIDNVLNPNNPQATPSKGDPPAFPSGSSTATGTPFTTGISATNTVTSPKATSTSNSTVIPSKGGAMSNQNMGAAEGLAVLFGLGAAVLIGQLMG